MTLGGIGLRTGRPCSVTLRPHPGPFALVVAGVATPRAELCVTNADRATTVAAGRAGIATVEHLLAACAALGIHDGLRVEVEGGEVPLLDGASAAFVRALVRLGLRRADPALVVARDATIDFEASSYAFGRGTQTRVEVTLEFDDPRLACHAAWDGTAADFAERIAPARTFALVHEVAELVARGQASHVAPESVVVVAEDAILSAGAPFSADEPARHKLLDLIGDLFLHAGPPLGEIHARRPGHRATHAIVREAIGRGVLARSDQVSK